MRFVAGLSLLVFTTMAMAETVHLRADPWFPYNGKPDAEKPGYMIEIARTVFNRHGLELDYQLLNWERSLKKAREGNVDCVVGAYKTDAPDFLFPEHSLGVDRMGFFAAAGNSKLQGWQYGGIQSLYNKRLGVIAAYSYGNEVDSFIAANADTHWVHTARGNDPLERNIRMLLAGRIDLLIESAVVLQSKLSDLGLSGEIVEVDQLPKQDKLYIACSPQSENAGKYIEMLDEGVTRLRQSGELERILKRYGLSDWE